MNNVEKLARAMLGDTAVVHESILGAMQEQMDPGHFKSAQGFFKQNLNFEALLETQIHTISQVFTAEEVLLAMRQMQGAMLGMMEHMVRQLPDN